MPEPEDPILLYNLPVILFNWLPSLGCLAVGVAGLIVGIRDFDHPGVGSGLYMLAAAAGFGLFGWVWRR